jgi:hypothetical protein
MVTRASTRGRKVRTGVAISMTEICAADLRLKSGARGWRMPLDPPAENGGGWPSLTSAFSELERVIGADEGSLAVALMPGLTEVRRLDLPPMADEDIERLLSRNAGKYFVNARAPQLVGASSTRKGRGQPARVVAAAAPAALVAKILGAARDAGWTVEDTGPAESAWAAAAVALWPAFAKREAHVVVAHDDRTDVLHLDDGRLTGVRRFRAGAFEASLVADTLREPGAAITQPVPVGLFGRPSPRGELARALADQRINAQAPPQSWAEIADTPDLLAAHFAGSVNGPVLRSFEARAMDRDAARKTTLGVLSAAALLFVLAGAVELWGVHRELDQVRADRARIKPQIAATFVGRTTIEAAYGHLATLTTAERAAPHWSAVLTTVTAALPDNAHLIGVRMRGDSIVMEGFAPHAARVFDALERVPDLTHIRAGAPVRREVQEDKTALEHFTIAALVRARESSASSTPPTTRTANAAARKVGQ